VAPPPTPDEPARCVYVLCGDDACLQDARRREIVARLIGDADPQVAVVTFDAAAEMPEVLNELRTLPFLAPRRVVIVRDADAFVSAYRRALEDYLQAPTLTSTLVLSVKSWPRGTRLYKRVARIGAAVDCSLSGRGALRTWAAEAARRRGKTLAADAAALLAETVGDDLATMDNEVEKLSLYVGRRKTITAEDVAALVPSSAAAADFALTNAVTAGDAPAALAALDKMLLARSDEFKITGQLAWHLRNALAGQQLAARGRPAEQAISPNTPARQKQAFRAMVRRRPLAVLQRDVRRLAAADVAMKSGGDARSELQQLVVSLCT
jgi:DNA polymerase-3 subunit delta